MLLFKVRRCFCCRELGYAQGSGRLASRERVSGARLLVDVYEGAWTRKESEHGPRSLERMNLFSYRSLEDHS